MITISVCMIVKNEEKVLARCLDSLAGLWEELIIVDTGSTDKTKEIASKYTDKIYDFSWTGNFSDARNFSFSKASCNYIYAADADEVLDEKNREKFYILKNALDADSEIEIVQMYYGNQLSQDSIYNFDKEYRPKLYKRLRSFKWQEPIHEAVRLEPVVFDSDIVIFHKPHGQHSERDLSYFEKMLGEGQILSQRMQDIYLRELYFAGDRHNLKTGHDFLLQLIMSESQDSDVFQKAVAILCKEARILKQDSDILKYSLKGVASQGCSELCMELGHYFYEKEDWEEASIWYYNAAYETICLMSLKAATSEPLSRLVTCYEKLGMPQVAKEYQEQLLAYEQSKVQ
ncbi:MAG: glycosyltransferase family 2 protein [Lachnospiraceae bacterium]|nr:glycosyltransferase family 2 protein [Lachnospiraceae bacterium]